jgi:hypothetical protein
MANGICAGSSHYTRPTTTKLARTWDWARIRRYAGPCNAPERLPPHQSYLGYTIVTRGSDFRERQVLVWLTRLWPSLIGLARVVQPDTILRWHRLGFRAYWRWKSCGQPGRPRVSHELRDLVRQMSKDNPLWGAPRIHGELLKLGFEVAESRHSLVPRRHRRPQQQGC